MSSWQSQLPLLSHALAPEYRALPAEDVQAVLSAAFGGPTALEDVESVLDDIGRGLSTAAKAVAPVAAKALPGAVAGAISGAPLGPFGMLGGALLGGTAGALSSNGRRGGPVAAVSTPRGAAKSLTGGGLGSQAASIAPTILGQQSGPAALLAQLLGVLGSPTTQKALASMLLGGAGARTVATPRGGQIPVAAITNLLSVLANRASAGWETAAPYTGDDYVGEGLDAANPEVRADYLYTELAPVDLFDNGSVHDDWGDAWLDDMYDAAEADFYEQSELDTYSSD